MASSATVESVKESVKETLLGTEDEPQLSSQTRAEFLQHAKKDEQTGEYYMGQHEFINAIAPESEDYVSHLFPTQLCSKVQRRVHQTLHQRLAHPLL